MHNVILRVQHNICTTYEYKLYIQILLIIKHGNIMILSTIGLG